MANCKIIVRRGPQYAIRLQVVLYFVLAAFLAHSWAAARPVLKVLTTFDPSVRAVMKRVHEFEAEHDCWVDWDPIRRSDVEEQLFGQSIAYDVVSVDEPWVAALANRLLPLADWPQEEDGAARQSHPLASWEGRCYGLMQLENLYLYVYRLDAFADRKLMEDFAWPHGHSAEPPASIEDFLSLARFFQDETSYRGLAFVRSPPESVVVDLIWCLEAAGVELSGEWMRGEPNLDKIREGLSNFRELHTLAPQAGTPPTLQSINQVYSRGDVAHLLQWTGFSEQLRDPLFSRVGTKTSFGPLPGGKGRAPFCITGHWFLCIPRAADQRVELAAAFSDWYHTTVQEETKYAGDVRRRLKDVAKVSRPRAKDYQELSKRLYAIAAKTMQKDASLDECVQRLIRDLSPLEFTNSERQP
jgi:hypothetical protein